MRGLQLSCGTKQRKAGVAKNTREAALAKQSGASCATTITASGLMALTLGALCCGPFSPYANADLLLCGCDDDRGEDIFNGQDDHDDADDDDRGRRPSGTSRRCATRCLIN